MAQTPIIQVNRKDDNKTLRELMLMQALQTGTTNIARMFQDYADRAEKKKLERLKFMYETGLDPDTQKPVDASTINPEVAKARQDYETRRRILAGEDVGRGGETMTGVTAPKPAPETLALQQESNQIQREGLGVQRDIAAGNQAVQQRLGNLEAATRERGYQSQEKIAGLDRQTRIDIARDENKLRQYVADRGFDVQGQQLMSDSFFKQLQYDLGVKELDLKKTLGEAGIKVEEQKAATEEKRTDALVKQGERKLEIEEKNIPPDARVSALASEVGQLKGRQLFEREMDKLSRRIDEKRRKNEARFDLLKPRIANKLDQEATELQIKAKTFELATTMASIAQKDTSLKELLSTYNSLPKYQGKHTDPDQAEALWATIAKAYESYDPKLAAALQGIAEQKQQGRAGWFSANRNELVDRILYGIQGYEKETNLNIPAGPGTRPPVSSTPSPAPTTPANDPYGDLRQKYPQYNW